MKNPPIVICSKTGKCLPVLMKSIECYVPRDVEIFLCGGDTDITTHRVYKFEHNFETSGAARKFINEKVWQHYDEMISADDDIVLNPNSYSLLLEDVSALKSAGITIGIVAGRTNYANGLQNVRRGQGQLDSLIYESENYIIETNYVAGIFCWVQKSTLTESPEISWYSDNIQCQDMLANGARHFVSRAYFHHIGSQTFGTDFQKCNEESREWIKAHRPDMYEAIYG